MPSNLPTPEEMAKKLVTDPLGDYPLLRSTILRGAPAGADNLTAVVSELARLLAQHSSRAVNACCEAVPNHYNWEHQMAENAIRSSPAVRRLLGR